MSGEARFTQTSKPITITGLIAEFIRDHKYMLVLYIVFLCIMPIRDIGIPHLFGKLIGAIETKGSMLMPLIYLFVATIVLQVGYSIIDILEIELSPRFQEFIRRKILKHIFEDRDENFGEVETGLVLARFMRLPHSLYTYLNQWKYIFIPNIILSVAAVAYFTSYNVILGTLLGMLIVFAWGMIYYSVTACMHHSYNTEQTVSSLYEETDDILKNISVVLVSNQQKPELDHIGDRETIYRESVKDTMMCSLKLRYLVVPFNVGYFVLFMCVCYDRVKSKKLKPSVFVALIIVMFKIFNSIWDLSGIMNDTVTRYGLLVSAMEVFNSSQQYLSAAGTTNPKGIRGIRGIRGIPSSGFFLDDVSFTYKNKLTETPLFQHLTLHIPKGQTVVVVGGIGSGKTTILKLLLKHITPQQGAVYYRGVPYDQIPTADLRRMIGFIQQQPVLLNRTVFENITYGLDIKRERVVALVHHLGLDDMFARFPDGLETNVGKYGSNLSGGQRQIILILRVILANPPVLLMDEPSASIDEVTKNTVYKLLSVIMKDRTVVMVTHDKYLLRFADRVVEMQQGRIVADNMTDTTTAR